MKHVTAIHSCDTGKAPRTQRGTVSWEEALSSPCCTWISCHGAPKRLSMSASRRREGSPPSGKATAGPSFTVSICAHWGWAQEDAAPCRGPPAGPGILFPRAGSTPQAQTQTPPHTEQSKFPFLQAPWSKIQTHSRAPRSEKSGTSNSDQDRKNKLTLWVQTPQFEAASFRNLEVPHPQESVNQVFVLFF